MVSPASAPLPSRSATAEARFVSSTAGTEVSVRVAAAGALTVPPVGVVASVVAVLSTRPALRSAWVSV